MSQVCSQCFSSLMLLSRWYQCIRVKGYIISGGREIKVVIELMLESSESSEVSAMVRISKITNANMLTIIYLKQSYLFAFFHNVLD